ncbi:uncharacterized protein J7T54_008463 [Emericellopsis cladophorae]|uniref:DUF7514 domain-containing protein n=1 Tax=Emericellopsis cladophorae TaxID=2686198 RepID=A0A9Q0BEF1_9HYPO|nr:uncharacterized protein J7T54_008463 [Emericellopsis cladophorae]KAI6782377.1 hypothetical protein J7T54_008463 [Emericellopsis cladophorae]
MATPTTASKEAPPQNAAKGAEIKYEYMFKKDKSPTEQLDALLRAIARHIALEIGDKTEYSLTPAKLAAFYKAVGGDYDALFVQNEHKSISWMWQITGCQHSLNPTDDDFAPPSIPALTPRGFCRWESLEILLGPDEHVPFLQYAVKHFNLKHPETGALFPPNLPRTVFPQEPDPEVDRWHKHCAAQLNEAAAKEGATDDQTSPEAKPGRTKPAPERPEFAEPKYAYVHVNHSNSSSERQHARPGAQRARPFTYSHVPGRSANTPGVPDLDAIVILDPTIRTILKASPSRPIKQGDDKLSPRRAAKDRLETELRGGFSDIDSEETSEPETSGEDLRRRRRKDERVRDGYKARPPPYELDRELDDDVDSGGRRYRPSIRRPEVYRRTSSHADIDRRRDQAGFDPRGRDRFPDDKRRYDRRSPNEGGSTSPMTGVTGRRYPAEPVYT